MKRTNHPTWERIGGGELTLNSGVIIPQGKTFRAAEKDIPAAFRDLVKLITTHAVKQEIAPVAITRSTKPKSVKAVDKPPLNISGQDQYIMKMVNPGWWKVIDKRTGKMMHDQLLRKSNAIKVKETLENE